MRVLALDTTTRDGSVALVEGDRVVAERRGDSSRTHAERLPQDLLALLDAEGVKLADVGIFAVASGPGSFTGLRIGIATIQGLAFVQRRPIVAVSALEALAHAGSRGQQEGRLVGSWMDAQRGEVFASLYRVAPGPLFGTERLTEVRAPVVRDPAGVLTEWEAALAEEPVLIIGDGAARYEAVIRSRQPQAQVAAPPTLAGTIGLMAVPRAAAGGALDAASVRPLYVRRPDAEIDRDRKAAIER